MQKYKDINNDSGVEAYDIHEDSITVFFKGSPKPYKYSYASAGIQNVEHMKKLAASGDGLNSFIMRNVKDKYVH